MTNSEINAKILEINLLEAQIKELKAIADARKNDIKTELDARNVEVIDTGTHRIFYEPYEKRTVDTKKLKAAGLYDEYSKVSVNILFKINEITNA